MDEAAAVPPPLKRGYAMQSPGRGHKLWLFRRLWELPWDFATGV
jgi:hypothetical protein